MAANGGASTVTKKVVFLGTVLALLGPACSGADPQSPFRNPGEVGAAADGDALAMSEPGDPTQQRGTVIVPRLDTGPVPAAPEGTTAPVDDPADDATQTANEDTSGDLLDATSQAASQSSSEQSDEGDLGSSTAETSEEDETAVSPDDATDEIATEPATPEGPEPEEAETEAPVETQAPDEPTNPVECPAERPVDTTSCSLELGVNCFFDDVACRCPFGGWACVDAAQIVNLPNRDADGNLINPEGCPESLDSGTACQPGVTCAYGSVLCGCDDFGMTCTTIP